MWLKDLKNSTEWGEVPIPLYFESMYVTMPAIMKHRTPKAIYQLFIGS